MKPRPYTPERIVRLEDDAVVVLDQRRSTLDLATPTGAGIPIEERDGAEVTVRFSALNPAFDVTPASLLGAILTEEGVHRPPYEASLPR